MDNTKIRRRIIGVNKYTAVGGENSIRSLVLFSGGIDSSYSLLRLLRETRDRVYAHHVMFMGPDKPFNPLDFNGAGPLVRRSLTWMRENLRVFEYSQSVVDLSGFETRARENTSLMYFAAQAAMNYGFTPFDRIILGVNSDSDPGWNPDSAVYAWRRTLLVRMLRSVWECDEVPHLYFWNPRPSKRAMLGYLPSELAQRTISCSDPGAAQDKSDPPVACNHCAQCRWRARVMRQQSEAEANAPFSATHRPPPCHPNEVVRNKMPGHFHPAVASDPVAL